MVNNGTAGDPRPAVIERRLEKVRRIVAISSGKGGVGKSLIASTLAIIGSSYGHSVGLFDLDFTGPSAHVVLGADAMYPEEEFGIVPPVVSGIQFMSIVHYLGDSVAPFRGADITNAITELLAITRWGELDTLFVDMPPGIGDTTLDVIRLLPRAEFVAVTTPSRLAKPVARRAVTLLREQGVPVIGTIVNSDREATDISDISDRFGDVPVLGRLPYDAEVETAIGDIDALRQTRFAQALTPVYEQLRYRTGQ